MTDTPISGTDFLNDILQDEAVADAWAEALPARAFSDLIIRLRTARGLSQEQLAERLGKQQPAVARMENASSNPTYKTLMECLEALGMQMHIGPSEIDCTLIPVAELHALRDGQTEAFRRGFAEGMSNSAKLAKSNALAKDDPVRIHMPDCEAPHASAV